MNKYELLTIVSASITDEAREEVIAKYTKLMESAGTVLTVNKMGVKKLAYPIDYKKEGFYVLFEFESSPELPSKINALMNIDENVLRSLCLKKELN